MAISEVHYRCLASLHERGLLPQGGVLLEFGEPEFYGDMDPRHVIADCEARGRTDLLTNIESIKADPNQSHALARVIYSLFCRPSDVVSIDKHGTARARDYDLNGQLPVEELTDYYFNVVVNHGTAEHIFDVAQVFRSAHEWCDRGGLMIHDVPFTGWIDHGFYNFQPTLFFDLCEQCCYDLEFMAVTHIQSKMVIEVRDREGIANIAKDGKLPWNAMLFVAMRKTTDEPFRVPMQGVYSGKATAGQIETWRTLR